MKILERQTKVYEIVGDNLEMLKVAGVGAIGAGVGGLLESILKDED